MKEGLVKITGEDNLYYDSITKQYKSAMHCPICGKYSGCWCYPDFDSIPLWEEEYPNTYCCDVHFCLDSGSDLYDIADALKITIKPTMEEWNASKIVRVYMEDIDTDYEVGEVTTPKEKPVPESPLPASAPAYPKADKKKEKEKEKEKQEPDKTGKSIDNAIQTVQEVVLELLKEKGSIKYEDIPDLLKEKGVNPNMVDWTSAVKRLMQEGYCCEPRLGVLRVV